MYQAQIISTYISKKGSLLVSLFRDSSKLVDNAVVSNPLNLTISVGDVVKGSMIYNNGSINTFVLTEIIK